MEGGCRTVSYALGGLPGVFILIIGVARDKLLIKIESRRAVRLVHLIKELIPPSAEFFGVGVCVCAIKGSVDRTFVVAPRIRLPF